MYAPSGSGPLIQQIIWGAPDLVVEILDPSNSATEIYDKEKLCLENGAKEFWVGGFRIGARSRSRHPIGIPSRTILARRFRCPCWAEPQ
jgi:hypothetical protein